MFGSWLGCWSLETASVWVWQGYAEIGVGHGDGFGGDWHGSPHGWLVLLGSAFPMGFFFFFFFFFFLILVFVPVGFWWAVVGMVEAQWW